MKQEIFDRLTKGVSIGREHPNYFEYDGEVCQLVCKRFPSRPQDYALISIERDEYGLPYTDTTLLHMNPELITMLVANPIN